MSFENFEVSTDLGRPIVLYQFTMGNTTWRYTSADEVITASTHQWLPVAISHDEISQTGEPLNEMLTINASSTIGPAQLFMSAVPPRGVMITIFEKHDPDPEVQVVYVGEVAQVGFPLPGVAKIRCETISSSMGREGLRLAWQRSCPYAVYDPTTCKLNMPAQARNFTFLNVQGNTITVEFEATVADGLLNDGFLEWTNPLRGIEYLSIDTQTIDVSGTIGTMSINGDPSDVVIGVTGKAYPTCALTPAACQAFGNYDNYGGHVDMPGKSPFDGLDSPFF